MNIYEAANLKMSARISLLKATNNFWNTWSLFIKAIFGWYEARSTTFLSSLGNLKYTEQFRFYQKVLHYLCNQMGLSSKMHFCDYPFTERLFCTTVQNLCMYSTSFSFCLNNSLETSNDSGVVCKCSSI